MIGLKCKRSYNLPSVFEYREGVTCDLGMLVCKLFSNPNHGGERLLR